MMKRRREAMAQRKKDRAAAFPPPSERPKFLASDARFEILMTP